MHFGIFDARTDVNACDCARGCMDTVRESGLKADSGEKIPCCTRELSLHQRCASPMLYQLSDIPTPVLYSLHWLLTSCRVQYKVSSLCHCFLSEGGPRYLSELLHKYTPSRQLRSSCDSFTLRVPATNRKTVGERSLSITDSTDSGTVSPLTFAP